VNDFAYLEGSVLNQTQDEILQIPDLSTNKITLFKLLDYITK